MLSRIAESLYWMSRYLERLDNTARLLDINVLYMLEADEKNHSVQWEPLLTIVGVEEAYQERYPGAVLGEQAIQFVVQEKNNQASLYNSLRLARENARVVRDRISSEMWEAVNEFWLQTSATLKKPLPQSQAAELFGFIRHEVARLQGLIHGTMMRGEAFGFTQMGMLLERADMTARILDVKYHLLLPDTSMIGSPLDYYQWGALLKSLSGFEAYRRLYQVGIRPIDVTEFIILTANFPRSLCYAVNGIEASLEKVILTRADSGVIHALDALKQSLTHATPQSILEYGLHEYLNDFLDKLYALHNALQREFFEAHLEAA